jgi:uncharacterized protein YfdQ (DUF2303 family)
MEPSTIHAAVEAGKALTQLHKVDGFKPVITLPGGPHLMLSHEKLSNPRYLTASPLFHDASAFIAYVNRFKVDETRLFYAQDGNFLAVIDYHSGYGGKVCPQHGDHVARLSLLRSPEWKLWKEHSSVAMSQQGFAEFLEDNSRDLLQPDPVTMLEVATGLQATVGATFRRAINQANGQVQVQWDENIDAKVAGGTKEIPATFQVGLRPFMGTERYPVECRLRYRVQGGNLSFHYKALHLDPITEAALEGIVAKIRDETGIEPALGSHDAKAFAAGT